MNLVHRWYCNSDRWARSVQNQMLPYSLRGIDLGVHLLEVGPGPGKTTDWLRERVPQITAIEIDPKLAASLKARMEGGNVTVVEGDATAMPFPDASFDSAVCYTMLHHVPAALHDTLLAEVARVLKPGAPFIGADSRPSFMWNIFHLFDDRNPVEPSTFAERLRRAGFAQAELPHVAKGGFGWKAVRGK